MILHPTVALQYHMNAEVFALTSAGIPDAPPTVNIGAISCLLAATFESSVEACGQ